MSTFAVTSGDLYAFADELAMLSSMLSSLTDTYGSADFGADAVTGEVGKFKTYWSSTAKDLGDDLGHLSQKVALAADAYTQTDAQVAAAASGGGP